MLAECDNYVKAFYDDDDNDTQHTV